MKIVISTSHQIEVTDVKDSDTIEVITPRLNVIKFSNIIPLTTRWFYKEYQTGESQGGYGVYKEKDTDHILNQLPLWKCVKWLRKDTTTNVHNTEKGVEICYFNFVTGKIEKHPSYWPSDLCSCQRDSMKGVFDTTLDLLIQVTKFDFERAYLRGESGTMECASAPPLYDDNKETK